MILAIDAIRPKENNGMNHLLRSALALVAAMFAVHASAQVTFYEHDNFEGRAFTTQRPVDDFTRLGFNDRASSVVVSGGRSATTPSSAATASSCGRAATPRCAR